MWGCALEVARKHVGLEWMVEVSRWRWSSFGVRCLEDFEWNYPVFPIRLWIWSSRLLLIFSRSQLLVASLSPNNMTPVAWKNPSLDVAIHMAYGCGSVLFHDSLEGCLQQVCPLPFLSFWTLCGLTSDLVIHLKLLSPKLPVILAAKSVNLFSIPNLLDFSPVFDTVLLDTDH